MVYDTTSSIPKLSCSKKLNIAPFSLIINDKPAIAYYLIQYDISSSFYICSLFHSLLKVPSSINLNTIKSTS